MTTGWHMWQHVKKGILQIIIWELEGFQNTIPKFLINKSEKPVDFLW